MGLGKIYKSSGTFPGSWEVQLAKPLDDRAVVDKIADLKLASTWKGADNNYYHYKGMQVVCLEDKQVYLYMGASGSTTEVTQDSNWIAIGVSERNGIPIYTKEYVQSHASDLPSNYITTDIGPGVVPGTTYADTLFQAIRHLLSEVAKLKNTFYYGLCSLNEGNTASSNIIIDSEEEEQEPLWAIDPEDLSLIDSAQIQIDTNCLLTPATNWTYSSDSNYVNVSGIVNTPTLINYDSLGSDIAAKVIAYSTIEATSNDWLFIINFQNKPSVIVNNLVGKGKWSIMFITSRRIIKEDGTTYNKNFNWICITNSNGDIQKLGYFDSTNKLVDLELDLDEVEVMSTIQLKNVKLYRLDYYTKNVSFSNVSNIIPTRPTIDDFVFRPAHITIRSVSTYELLELLEDRIYNNELIFCAGDDDENAKGLYIKFNNEILALGALGGSGTGEKTTTTITFPQSSISLLVGSTALNIATTNSTANITYISSNSSVVTVSADGTITAISPGTAVITAKVSSNSSYTSANTTYNVTVTEVTEASWRLGDTYPATLTEDSAFLTFPATF